MSGDKWFTDSEGVIRAGVIKHFGKRTLVGDVSFLPAKFGGQGLGVPERKRIDADATDNEAPDLADVMDIPNEPDQS